MVLISSIDRLSNVPGKLVPAQLIKTSTTGTLLATSAHAIASVTSSFKGWILESANEVLAASNVVAVRAAIVIRAGGLERTKRAFAVAKPIPLLPPVIKT
jgi:hypothetical protein